MSLFSRKKKKAVVLGLDGVPHTLLQQFLAQGILPNMKRIFDQGNLRRMEVTVPEISSVSWPSFMTGVDPGTHGVFGFTELLENSYDMYFPNFTHIKAPTIWDQLEKQGKRSIVLNQPGTYPAKRINGVLVSGFVAIEMHKAVFPAKYIGKLKRLDYDIDIDTNIARKNHNFAFQELDRTLEGRRKAVDLLWDNEEWDYFELVVTGTDRLHHYLWHALTDENHRHHERAIGYYRAVDAFAGEMAERYVKATKDDSLSGFFMLSDHGFCALEKEVALTRFLLEKGLMKFDTEEPTELGEISSESKVFLMDPNRIYVHTSDRFPKGGVDPADKAKVVEDVKAALGELEFEGRKLVRRFFHQEEAYHGPFAAQGPDLVAVSIDGFDFKGSPDRREVFGHFGLTGMHNQNDAFLWTTKPVDEVPIITQVAGLILDHLK
ncbi:MAG: alkaline phosphatase family protein [Candidatus Lernaella stagnicola]|nr:alkaline phosphatase family protein [Candidatus Lernaella stagnicola]